MILDGHPVAIFHAPSGWYALDAVCPHADGPLADGIVADSSVICPLHERRFDLRSGQEVGGSLCVASHRLSVRGDHVFLTVDKLVSAHRDVVNA